MQLDISRHPCFNEHTREVTARIHLPVAPRCNVQCNFCNRKFDCMNESRPGVSSCIVSPGQALAYLHAAIVRQPAIAVVGIAGPGDPFANPDETMETMRRVHHDFPQMLLCVATNGLGLPQYAHQLAELGVSHVTVTINAVDPEIGGQIYAWVRDNKHIYRGRAAGQIMLERQLQSIGMLKEQGIIVKVNTIVIPGINEHHVGAIAAELAPLGVDRMNCMPLMPVAGTAFGSIEPLSSEAMSQLRLQAQQFIPQMRHCAKCRADAAGFIGQANSDDLQCCLQRASALPLEPAHNRPYIAVSSREGLLINQHLGEAEALWIFARDSAKDSASEYRLLESRPTPAAGGGGRRWQELADSLNDCQALLCSGAGESPRSVLGSAGINVVTVSGLIQEALDAVFNGRPVKAPLRQHRCGVGCSGDGSGCN